MTFVELSIKEKAMHITEIVHLMENNKFDEALTLIYKYEEENGINATSWTLRGMLALRGGEYNIAVECFKKGLLLDRSSMDLYYNLAYTYEKMNEWDKAVKNYKQVILLSNNTQEQEEIEKLIEEIEKKNYDKYKRSEIIIKDTTSKSMPKISDELHIMREDMANLLIDDEAPLVTIILTAYNNLEKYTKKCVECLLKYTKNVDYELILLDNGSSDGTLEYFESIPYAKKKIVRVNHNVGASYGGTFAASQYRGKYLVYLANDVYVTKNWLLNMVKCAESDPKIGMVTPQSDYISNMQSVDWDYIDFDDMQKKAEAHNISDMKKWEERIRLITIGTMYKKACWDMIGVSDYGFIHDFGDDDLAFRVRRAGYKAILCKDVFVSHVGKIDDKGAEIAKKSLAKGREDFKKKYFGIDAWDDVNNFEQAMLSLLNTEHIQHKEKIKVLGVNVLCGTPILECKNRLRNQGKFNVELSAYSTQAKYWLDLKTICDGKVEVDRLEYISQYFEDEEFDIIVIGEALNHCISKKEIMKDILRLLNKNGQALVKIKNRKGLVHILENLGCASNQYNKEIDNHSVDVYSVHQFLANTGCRIEQIGAEPVGAHQQIINQITDLVSTINSHKEREEIYREVSTLNYVLSIIKE